MANAQRLATDLASRDPIIAPAALYAAQNPADNYQGGFRNPDGSERSPFRTVTNRRRTRSTFTIVFQPNIVNNNDEEATRQAQLYSVVADQMFTRPDILREIFYAIDLPRGYETKQGKRLKRDGLFATAGDRYDANHVFEHYYSVHPERGARLDRVHINVDFYVLHDSAFRLNTRLAGMIFKLLLNREIRRRGLPNRWLRPVDSVGVYCSVVRAHNGGDAGLEYDAKDDPVFRGQFTRRRQNATRGGQPATKITRAPVIAQLPTTPAAAGV
jgi:hypothetical protein